MSGGKPYGFQAVCRSLRYFAVGKGITVVTTLASLVLLARSLSPADYAVYISLQAVILLGGAISSVGIQSVLVRYLPELKVQGNRVTMYRLLVFGVLIRMAMASGLLLLVLQFLPPLADVFHFKHWLWLAPWFLCVGVLQLTVITMSQALGALLWQREAQYSLAAGGAAKLLLLVAMVAMGYLSFPVVVIIEGICQLLILILFIRGYYIRWRNDPHRAEGDRSWLRVQRRRLLRFGLWSFGLRNTSIWYGSAPNRLLGAHFLPVPELAVLGFADGLTNLGRRLMPTRLLISMVRPIFVARFTENGRFEQIAAEADLVYRLNTLILMLPIALLLVAGEPLFNWVTAGKYGSAAPLFAGFLIVLIAESRSMLLDLLTQATEKNQVLLAKSIESASLLLAIPFIGQFGVWALIGANLVGKVSANLVIVYWLGRYGFRYRGDLIHFAAIFGFGLVATAAGMATTAGGHSLVAAGFITAAVYIALCLLVPPFNPHEKNLIGRVLSELRRPGRAVIAGP